MAIFTHANKEKLNVPPKTVCVYDMTVLGTAKHCRKSDDNMESGSTSGAVSECVQTL